MKSVCEFRKFIPFAKQILFNHLHYIDLYTGCQCPNRGYLAKISYKLQIHVIVIPGSRAFVRERIDQNQRCEQNSPSKTSSRRKSICQGVEKIFTSARMDAGRDGICQQLSGVSCKTAAASGIPSRAADENFLTHAGSDCGAVSCGQAG